MLRWWTLLLCTLATATTLAQDRSQRPEITFQCPYAYTWTGEKCDRVHLPPNAHFDKNAAGGWSCNRGFVRLENRCFRAQHLQRALQAAEATDVTAGLPTPPEPIHSSLLLPRRRVGSTVEILSRGSTVDYDLQRRSPDAPNVAENGSYYGQISHQTGRPRTVHVKGYTRKDGTYVSLS